MAGKQLVAAALIVLTAILMAPASASAGHLKMGVFAQGQGIDQLDAYEQQVGIDQDYFMLFRDWAGTFPTGLSTTLINRGTIPIITWEPWGRSLDSINAGTYDTEIREYAQGAKSVSGTILLRPMHEMNGNWYPWGVGTPGNTPAKYQAAFKRIVTLFRQEGAGNVKFVWSPNHNGPPSWDASTIPSFYPGDAYVDYIGLSGFNFGTVRSDTEWRSFETIYNSALWTAGRVSSKPIIICEMASGESGGNKAAWIRDTFKVIEKDFPKIHGVVWFNVSDANELDVGSSTASLNAFKAATESPHVRMGNPGSWKLQAGYGSIWLVSWSWAEGGLAKVTFYVDGKLEHQDYGSPYAWQWNLVGERGGWHVIKINAFDKDWKHRSLTKWVYVVPDSWGPALYITNPVDPTLRARYQHIWIVASTSDPSGIAKVTFSTDGRLRSQDYGAPYAWKWNLETARHGWHLIKVNSFDRMWNVSTKTRWVYVTQ